MARKPKTAKQIAAQWEKRLRKAGLSMEAGTSRRITYIGGSKILEDMAGAEQMGTRNTDRDKDITYRGYTREEDVAG